MFTTRAYRVAVPDIRPARNRQRGRPRFVWCIAAFSAPAWSSSALRAIPPELVQAIPTDVTAAYLWQGPRAADGTGSEQGVSALAGVLIDGALRVGVLSMVDPTLRAWIDGVAASVVAARYPFALLLFDARAKRTARGGHACADLRAALVMLSRKDNDILERRIRHLLTSYTNRDETTLETHDNDGHLRFVLHDRRLPEWARFEWGAVGDFYIVSVGAGSFDRVLDVLADRGVSMAKSPWFRRAARELALPRSAIALYFRPASLVRDADPDLRRKLDRARQALHIMDAQRLLATLRRDERVITVQIVNDHAGDSELQTIAAGAIPRGAQPDLIPNEATRYTVIPWNARTVLRAVQDAVLSVRSLRNQDRLRRFWRTVEAESGVSFDRDVAARLGGFLIIHNAPRHALNLPFAWTYVIPFRGEATSLRERLDTLLAYARDHSDPNATCELRKDPDGVWYLSAGLTGPALAVSDHAVVVSFSPAAVREYRARAGARQAP